MKSQVGSNLKKMRAFDSLYIEYKSLLGTPILVESPFVRVLERDIVWELKFCHNCFRQVFAGIPCPTCSFVSNKSRIYLLHVCTIDLLFYLLGLVL